MPLIRGEVDALEPRMRVARRADDIAVLFDDEPGWKLMFKLIEAGILEPHLYHFEVDPLELDNLVEQRPGRFRTLFRRYKAWSDAYAPEDDLYRGKRVPIQSEDIEMLRALGYVGDDEDPAGDGGH